MSSPHQTVLPLDLPWRAFPGYHCFGCCGANPAGLKLAPTAVDGGLTCSFSFTRLHESYPGIVHGGISATVLDEMMGNAIALLERKICFTVGIKVRYLGPLMTGEPYRAVARILGCPTGDDGFFKTEGEILDAHERPLVIANATYQWISVDQADAVMSPGPSRTPGLGTFFRHPHQK